jgi:metallophosphoesterase superfamily enzyme
VKIAVISDLHLGDPNSIMANQRAPGPGYEKFKSNVTDRFKGPMDYLVLLGDVMDFAVSRYQEAYQAGKVFFNQLVKDNIAGEIIYIPGNHDFDLWHVVEYEVNIINKIARNK